MLRSDILLYMSRQIIIWTKGALLPPMRLWTLVLTRCKATLLILTKLVIVHKNIFEVVIIANYHFKRFQNSWLYCKLDVEGKDLEILDCGRSSVGRFGRSTITRCSLTITIIRLLSTSNRLQVFCTDSIKNRSTNVDLRVKRRLEG